MTRIGPLDKNKINNFLADIESSLVKLKIVANKPKEILDHAEQYAIAEHYLRRALEGILTVGTHIVSRLPTKTKDYQEIIITLGKHGIIPVDFAEKNRKLAGYRNRLVHLYWEIDSKEMHQLLNEHLGDLEAFCDYFKQVLARPQDFNLTLE